MENLFLTVYVLVWPVLAAAVLAVLSYGVWKDISQARRDGEHLV